jgi:SAM-dependent methyltransferase
MGRNSEECPLCGATGNTLRLRSSDDRDFTYCEVCKLIYVDRPFLPDSSREQERYLEHNNDSDSVGYASFLSRVLDPLLPYMSDGAICLDYGCGPIPVLAEVVRSEGFTCWAYDPIFYPDGLAEAAAELGGMGLEAFDVIFSTECFEHFHQPAETISEIVGMLRKGGYLSVMTEMWTDLERFSNWYYTRDDTHVVFYHALTFDWICETFGLKRVWTDEKRVVVLQKL